MLVTYKMAWWRLSLGDKLAAYHYDSVFPQELLPEIP